MEYFQRLCYLLALGLRQVATKAYRPGLGKSDTRKPIVGKKSKPPAPTLLKRSTARNLAYLERKGLIKPIDGRNLRIALSLNRRRPDGTIVRDRTPTGAV